MLIKSYIFRVKMFVKLSTNYLFHIYDFVKYVPISVIIIFFFALLIIHTIYKYVLQQPYLRIYDVHILT